MKRRLIVNADGFGFTFGNNRGILECLPAGVVRSVSVNANFPAVREVPDLRRFPGISVGIHFNLSVGPCVAEPARIPHLVTPRGEFLGSAFGPRLMKGGIPQEELVVELTAQLRRMFELGVELTHWDSHQNLHLLPPFFRAAIRVAKSHGISRMRTHDHHLVALGPNRRLRIVRHLLENPGRGIRYLSARGMMYGARRLGMRMADRLVSPGPLGDSMKYERHFWVQVFRSLPAGTSEVYCHPGYPDEDLRRHASYVEERQKELEVLRDPTLAEEARRQQVELISFHEV